MHIGTLQHTAQQISVWSGYLNKIHFKQLDWTGKGWSDVQPFLLLKVAAEILWVTAGLGPGFLFWISNRTVLKSLETDSFWTGTGQNLTENQTRELGYISGCYLLCPVAPGHFHFFPERNTGCLHSLVRETTCLQAAMSERQTGGVSWKRRHGWCETNVFL